MTKASTAGMTNASLITELAGCSAKNKGEMEPSISTYQSDDSSTTSSLEDLGLVEADTHTINQKRHSMMMLSMMKFGLWVAKPVMTRHQVPLKTTAQLHLKNQPRPMV
jgi:hypothetical protein